MTLDEDGVIRKSADHPNNHQSLSFFLFIFFRSRVSAGQAPYLAVKEGVRLSRGFPNNKMDRVVFVFIVISQSDTWRWKCCWSFVAASLRPR